MKKQYLSYQETVDFLAQAMEKYPNLIRLESIGDTHEAPDHDGDSVTGCGLRQSQTRAVIYRDYSCSRVDWYRACGEFYPVSTGQLSH